MNNIGRNYEQNLFKNKYKYTYKTKVMEIINSGLDP